MSREVSLKKTRRERDYISDSLWARFDLVGLKSSSIFILSILHPFYSGSIPQRMDVLNPSCHKIFEEGEGRIVCAETARVEQGVVDLVGLEIVPLSPFLFWFSSAPLLLWFYSAKNGTF